MKAQKYYKIILAVLFFGFGITAFAQPGWDVNPNQYAYSMTVTGKVSIENRISNNEGDIVAAFINGECRGVSNVKYQAVLDDYFVFLMIYSNSPIDEVTLKIYDASAGVEIDVLNKVDFLVNDIVGSVSSPLLISGTAQIFGAYISNFTIPNQEGSTSIKGRTISLSQVKTGDLSKIKASFSLSFGAKAYVNGVEQISGVTENDFRNSVQYTVVPQVGLSKVYTVTIRKAIDASTEITISNSAVIENSGSTLIGTLEVDSNVLENTDEFSLSNTSFSENDNFYLVGNQLFVKDPLNYEIQSAYAVNIRVENSGGEFAEKLFNVEVINENDPPFAISLSTSVLSESTSLNNTVARISVEDEDFGDVHHFTLKPGDGGNHDGNSFFTIQNDSLVLTKPLSQDLPDYYSIMIIASDSSGATFEQEWNLQVVDINFAPEFLSKPLNYAIQNQVYVYAIEVKDNENDNLAISFEELPEWLTYNPKNGLLTGTPKNDNVGDFGFSIIVSDGSKQTFQQVVLSVLNVNDPPEINSYPGMQYFYPGTDNVVALAENCITDPDTGDQLTFRLSMENNSALPGWLQFDPLTMQLTGNPPDDQKGIYNLKLTATDQGQLKEWLVFTLEVSYPTAIGDQQNQNGFNVYPNPVQNEMYLDIPNGEDAVVSMSNIAGQLVKTWKQSDGLAKSVSVAGLLPGIYFIHCKQGDENFIKKIIKK